MDPVGAPACAPGNARHPEFSYRSVLPLITLIRRIAAGADLRQH